MTRHGAGSHAHCAFPHSLGWLRTVSHNAATHATDRFVNTFKRDYVARMDLRDAGTVLAQLPAAFEHLHEEHPHSSLKMRSSREFRRQQAVANHKALYCELDGSGSTGTTSANGCNAEFML
jgi:hypothetical protein